MIAPDFFGNPATRNYWPTNSYVGITLSVGIVPLILIIFSLAKNDRHKTRLFYVASIIVVLVLMTKNPLSMLLYKIQIPILSSIQPNKLSSLLMFSMAILSAFALENMKQMRKMSNSSVLKVLIAIIVTLVICLLEVYFVAEKGRNVALKSTFMSLAISIAAFSSIIAAFKIKQLKGALVPLLFIVLIAEQYYFFQKFNPFSPRSFIFPQTDVVSFLQNNSGIDRFWGYGTAGIESNIATQYRLFSSNGFDALNLKWYNEFIRTSVDGTIPKTFTHETRSVAEIAPGYGETDLPDNHYRLRVLDMLGTKYIVDRVENPRNDRTFPSDRFKLVWEDQSGWKVFENMKRAQRYFLSNNVIKYKSINDFETLFFSDEFDPRTMVLVESDIIIPELCTDEELKQARVTLIEYEPNQVLFETNSFCNTFLYLSDTYDNKWRVTINNQDTFLVKTNYAFRGLFVPPGKHTVHFTYSLF